MTCPLRLISFFTRLGCSHLSLGFPPQSNSLDGRFFTGFPFKISPQRTTTHPTEFASKKEDKCNVIVTKSINHMNSAHDYSHDLLIWSWHMTDKLYLDIKASLILTSASPFVQILSHHWSQYLRHHFYIMITSWSPLSSQHALSNKSTVSLGQGA